MALTKLVLLNPVTILGSPKVVQAGSVYDSSTNASDVTALVAAGGILVPQGAGLVNTQSILAQSLRVNKGRNEEELAMLMLAAGLSTPDPLMSVQGSAAGSIAEVAVFSLAGSGSVVGAYYLPSANLTPAAGSNNQVVLFNIYDNTGTLVGQLATGTIANATPLVKWVRFSFGAVTNGIFGDGYTVTVQSTLTGAATIPAGNWVLVTKPTYN